MPRTVDVPARPVNRAVPKEAARAIAARAACVGVSAACLLVIAGPALPSSSLPAVLISATGKDHHWTFRHAGPDGVLGTGDDRVEGGVLRLPAHQPVTLALASADYLYTLALPASGVRGLAVPDLPQRLQIVTGGPSEGVLAGGELCGVPTDVTALRVMEASGYAAWSRGGH